MTMPFLPNEADATHSDQSEPDSVDFEILLLAHRRTGVLSGCEVTESGTPAQTIDVAAGVVTETGEQITVSTQTGVSVTAADGSNPRFDLISINSSGTAVVTAGTPAAQPTLPDVPASSVPLAALYVAASDNTHTNGQIVDKRVFIADRYVYSVKDFGAVGDDSTNDTTAIQDTLNAVATSGGVVLIPRGTYLVTSTLDVNDDSVHIIAQPGATLHRTGAGDCVYVNGASAGAKVNDILIKGLSITGPSVVGTQVAGSGILIKWGSHVRISECDVSGFGSENDEGSIAIYESEYVFVEDCDLHASENGLVTGRAATSTIPEAINCIFRGNRAYGNWTDGIHSQHSTRIIYNSNQCYGNSESGIDLLGDDGDTVVGNVCYNNTNAGIEVGNTTVATGSPDKNHTISGNTSQGNGGAGILLVDEAEYNTVVGNTCEGNTASGIQISGGSNAGVSYNIISGNTCEGNTQRGIYIVNDVAVDNMIIGNLCRNNLNRGIYIANAGGGDPTGNVVIGNYSEGNTTSDITDASAGTNIIRRNFGAAVGFEDSASEVATATTLAWNESVLNVDTSGGSVAITLPDNATFAGKSYLIRRDGASAVTISRAGADTFDDAATSKTLGSDGAAIGIFSIGDTEWKIVGTQGTVT